VDVARRGRVVVGPVARGRVHRRRRDGRLVHYRVPERDQLRRGHGDRCPVGQVRDRQVRRVSRGRRVRAAVARDRHGRRPQRVRAAGPRHPGSARGRRPVDSAGAPRQVQFPDEDRQRAPGRRVCRDRVQRPGGHRSGQDEATAVRAK